MMMRAIGKTIGAALAVLCALGLVLAMAMGVRSHFVAEQWRFEAGGAGQSVDPVSKRVENWDAQYSLVSGGGKLQLVRVEKQHALMDASGYVRYPSAADGVYQLVPEAGLDGGGKLLGIEVFDRPRRYFERDAGGTKVTGSYWGFRYMTAPWWMVGAGMAVWPIVWGWRRRLERKRKIAAGLCAGCGYDLRASQGRCPECGREF